MGGKRGKRKKEKVVSSYSRTGGIALRYGNRLEAARKTVKPKKPDNGNGLQEPVRKQAEGDERKANC